MFSNPFKSFNFLKAAETLDFKSFAFVFDVVFKIWKIDSLLNHVIRTFMLNLDLWDHLSEQFILNWLVDWLNYLNWVTRRIFPRLITTIFFRGANDFSNFFHFAVVTLDLVWSDAVFVGKLQFTQETNDFIAVVTLFCL